MGRFRQSSPLRLFLSCSLHGHTVKTKPQSREGGVACGGGNLRIGECPVDLAGHLLFERNHESQAPISTRHHKGSSMMPWSGYPALQGARPVVTGTNDESTTYGYSAEWDLQEFIDATDAEVILGTGRKDGFPRSFVLVPQPNAGN